MLHTFFSFWIDTFRHLGHLIIMSLLFIPKFVDTVLQNIHSHLFGGHNNCTAAINYLLLFYSS